MSSQAQESGPSAEMGELLDSMKPIKPLRRGDVVEGVVMRADSDGIFVNVGAKAEGVVPPGEMKTMDAADRDKIAVGDDIVTFVVRSETAEEGAILSIDRAVGEQGWRVLEVAMESGDLIKGKILGFNRGGAIAEAEGVQGFVPISQLVSVPRAHFRDAQRQAQESQSAPQDSAEATGPPASESSDGEVATSDPEQQQAAAEAPPAPPVRDPREDQIGKELELRVLEVNRGRNRAIFSERQAIQERRDAQKARLIEELTEGEVRSGKVTGISSFGAFVDLGGADGLIHISELSWDQVNSPDEVVRVGDELKVYVLRVDAENKRIALSLRRLQPEPWETINERYQVDDIVDAAITKLTNFGAFARVEGSVEGLIHISELTPRMISHPREVVNEGQAIRVKILRIEPERRRLGLSLKQAEDEEGIYSPYEPAAESPSEVETVALEPEGTPSEYPVADPEPEASVDGPVETEEESEALEEDQAEEPEPEQEEPEAEASSEEDQSEETEPEQVEPEAEEEPAEEPAAPVDEEPETQADEGPADALDESQEEQVEEQAEAEKVEETDGT